MPPIPIRHHTTPAGQHDTRRYHTIPYETSWYVRQTSTFGKTTFEPAGTTWRHLIPPGTTWTRRAPYLGLERYIRTDIRALRILLPKDQIITTLQLHYKAYLSSALATLIVGSFKRLSIVYILYHLIDLSSRPTGLVIETLRALYPSSPYDSCFPLGSGFTGLPGNES
jgi:hypothetical protein